MATKTTVQRGLFGGDYEVGAACAECGEIITCEAYKDLDGEKLCADCFNKADLVECPECNKVVERSDCRENPDGYVWCEGCIDEGCITCERCDSLAWADDYSTVIVCHNHRVSSETWCESCVSDHATACNNCGDTIDSNDSVRVGDDSDICQSCYENSYFTCEECGNVWHCDDCYTTDDGCYCSDCEPSSENFGPAGFRDTTGCIAEIRSARCYGIELETDGCDGYEALHGSPAWGAKDDSTVSGKEFYSDILSGDAGLDAVRDWGKMAHRKGWHVTDNAGYHLHIDMRGESDDQLYGIAYAYRATQEVWLKFVDRARSNGAYSNRCGWTCADIDEAAGERTFYSWCGHRTRYHWFNTCAYRNHSTFEIRAHEGTCDDVAVINWVKAHTRFADWASTVGYAGVKEALDGMTGDEMFEFIAQVIWRDDNLRAYYVAKSGCFNNARLTRS